jgi:glycosyltransferase involved in cell wall biosynthesis
VRIVYLHQYFNTPEMSGSTRSYEMGRRLVAAGHQVDLITSARDAREGNEWIVEDIEGMRVHWTPIPYSNALGYRDRIRAFFAFATRAARRAAELDADVVFATSTPLTIALPGAWAARRQGVPMVFEVRDMWPELPIAVGALSSPPLRFAARRLERFAYQRSARVVALSPDMKRKVAATGYPAERIAVIPNSSDLDLFDPAAQDREAVRASFPWLGDRPLVLYAGTLGLINGVDYLARIAAAAAEWDPDVRFLVVGDGGQAEQVRGEAARLGVLDRSFFMLPAVPKRRVPGLFAAADMACSLFIDLEPMWANSANKVFDGLSAGRPIAINYEGWQADLIRETGAGLVLDRHDPGEAARQLVERVRDRPWLAETGTAALRLARERFDRDRLAAELEGVLRAAAEETDGAR